MSLGYFWLAMVVGSIICAAATGRLAETSAAALDGAAGAVELSIGLIGTLCLWNGVLEAMKRCGLDRALAQLLHRPLELLMPELRGRDDALGAAAANVSANLLGLGNAATPLGIRAAQLMPRSGGVAGDALCSFVVLNTASLQVLPATVAALRAQLGAADAFDVLPAVWCTSAVALGAGLAADRVLRRVWPAGLSGRAARRGASVRRGRAPRAAALGGTPVPAAQSASGGDSGERRSSRARRSVDSAPPSPADDRVASAR